MTEFVLILKGSLLSITNKNGRSIFVRSIKCASYFLFIIFNSPSSSSQPCCSLSALILCGNSYVLVDILEIFICKHYFVNRAHSIGLVFYTRLNVQIILGRETLLKKSFQTNFLIGINFKAPIMVFFKVAICEMHVITEFLVLLIK